MNKYIVTVFTDFEKREYSAIANSWVDPKLNEIAETMGYILVEESVPQEYIMQVEGYDVEDWDTDLLADVLSNTDMSDYFNICIEPFEGTDTEFGKYELIYQSNEEA